MGKEENVLRRRMGIAYAGYLLVLEKKVKVMCII